MELLSLMFLSGAYARPIWETPESATMRANLVFISTRDIYRMSYSGYPTSADSSRLNFWSSDDTYYSLDSTNTPSGVYYLTCNGRYILEVFSGGVNGTKVAETGIKVTTKIQNPTCQSFSDQQNRVDDLGVNDNNGQLNQDGKIPLTWNPVPGATKYEIYKDGELIGETPGTSWEVDGPGGLTIVAKDANDEIVGESDYDPPDPFPTNGGGEGGGCDGCQFLKDMLACPDWDQYMGELTGAIEAALPPPPDWDSIADKIGNSVISKLDAYMGDVPEAPSKQEIRDDTQTGLPPVDTSVPEAENLTPQLPPEFNQPQEFDLDDAPVIEVADESQPFIIEDPIESINSSGENVPVYPGDPVNHADGIAAPEVNEGSVPIPEATTYPGTDPAPVVPMPTPAPGTGTTPIPSSSTGDIPIPSGGGGLPIPGGG
jgi:hypothetical protein